MAGAMLKLESACEEYGVTEEQCHDANIPCKRRCYFGNFNAVVKRTDVIDLKRNLLVRQEKAAMKQAGIEKY